MSKIIIIILLLELATNMIVFPFKTTYVNKNGNISKDSIEYNTTHFGNDNFEMPLYTQIKIGNPPQNLTIILSSDTCGAFKIGNSTKCVHSDEYLSYYNRSLSNDFNFTNVYNGTDSEFDIHKKGQTAEDTLYAYSDPKLENITQFKGIGFFLGPDTTDKLCGTIGFKKDELICSRILNITTYLKERDYINNYKFIIKYNSTEEGSFIIGSDFKDIISDYNENKIFAKKVNLREGLREWEINIDEIKVENSDMIIDNSTTGIFLNDFSLIMGSKFYRNYTVEVLFKDYLDQGICSFNLYDKAPSLITYYKYQIIECDKGRFGPEDIKKFPKLLIRTRELGTLIEFSFDYNDLFTETKYKYFYNVIFDYFGYEKWQFGKVFLKKYPINFDYDSGMIEIYDYYYKDKVDPIDPTDPTNQGNNGEEKPDHLVLYIIIIVILVIITGVVGYFLGKYINKIRKKRANELIDDDFDYLPESARDTKQDENQEIKT